MLPGETVAVLMGEMGRAFDGGYAEYALVPEHLNPPAACVLATRASSS